MKGIGSNWGAKLGKSQFLHASTKLLRLLWGTVDAIFTIFGAWMLLCHWLRGGLCLNQSRGHVNFQIPSRIKRPKKKGNYISRFWRKVKSSRMLLDPRRNIPFDFNKLHFELQQLFPMQSIIGLAETSRPLWSNRVENQLTKSIQLYTKQNRTLTLQHSQSWVFKSQTDKDLTRLML